MPSELSPNDLDRISSSLDIEADVEELWLCCEACNLWRLVDKKMHDEYPEESGRPWYCNIRPGTNCETPLNEIEAANQT